MDAYTAGRWDETDLAQIRGIWYRSKEKGWSATPPRGQ